MTKGWCRLVPGQPEVAVLWLCIPNLLPNFFQNCAVRGEKQIGTLFWKK
jgi:hypothetical protein